MKPQEEKKPEQTSVTTFDDVLRLAGGSGRWQLFRVIWLSKNCIDIAFFMMSMIFLGAVPPHRCADGFVAAGAGEVRFEDLPPDAPSCPAANATCERWVYDLSDIGFTMVPQWDLVCSRKPLLPLIQSLSQAGGLLGAFVTGPISDRFGRRLIHLTGFGVYGVTSALLCVIQDYNGMLALRFVAGVGLALSLSPLICFIMEILTPEWRLLAGMLIQIPWAFGVMILSGLAYSLPTWWHLQIALAAPVLLHILDVWMMPESPRWLVLNDRLEEAAAIVKNIAAGNRATLPDDERLMQLLRDVRDSERKHEQKLKAEAAHEGCQGLANGFWQLLKTSNMRRYMLISWVAWVASGMSYYGISFDIGQLSSNRFIGNCLSGLVEIPAYLLPWATATRWGRKPTIFILYLLAAIAILPTIASDAPSLRLGLGLVGKFAATGAFGLLYIYTPEYIPTVIRNIGLGVSSVAARLGSMVAPFIIDVAVDAHPKAPAAIFGTLVLLSGFTTLLLPETAGRRLPETVADVELGTWQTERADRRETVFDLCPALKRRNAEQTNGDAEKM